MLSALLMVMMVCGAMIKPSGRTAFPAEQPPFQISIENIVELPCMDCDGGTHK